MGRLLCRASGVALVLCSRLTALDVLSCCCGVATCSCKACSSRWRTSWSVVCEKFSYQKPTAKNASGLLTHTSSSTCAANSSHVAAAAAGTAMTMRAGCSCLTAATATRMVTPGGNPIIDEDDGPTMDVIGGAVSSVEAFASLQLVLLVCCHLVDHLLGDTEHLHDVVIEHTHPTRGNGSHRQFFLPRDTQLADDEDIQRGMQCSSHFKRNGYPTPR